jgi:hypothetical protein
VTNTWSGRRAGANPKHWFRMQGVTRAECPRWILGGAVLAVVIGSGIPSSGQWDGGAESSGVVVESAPESSALIGDLNWHHPDAGYQALDGAVVHDACECPACCPGGSGSRCHRRGRGLLNHLFGHHCPPRWQVQVDALMLWQGNIASVPLLESDGDTILDAADAQTAMSTGVRTGVLYHFSECVAMEGNYFNVRPFTATELADFDSADLPFLPGSPTVTGGAWLVNKANIQSAEWNLRWKEGPGPLTWLAGFRWVEWNQWMSLDSSGDVASQTGNDLYGGQIGADLALWNGGGPVQVHGVGKAGLFYNNAFQRTWTNLPGSGLNGVFGERDLTSFFGEVGINASYWISQKWAWRLGYSFFWLSGVAVPANQLGVADVGTARSINGSGSVLLHGLTTGLEARW